MKSTMHLAAQYLATAAISFIPKKDDDSHTNLGWVNHALETHPFPNGDKLGLNYEHFSLEWKYSNGNTEHLLLNNLKHKEIVEWISQMAAKNDLRNSYAYNLHYELPYPPISETTSFAITNQNELNHLIKNRDLAQYVISNVLEANHYKSPIRIWPHHFDTGAFINVTEKRSIGLGMATPDTIINDYYFYISGYNGHQPIDVTITNSSTKKTYYNDGWQGFAMSISELDKSSAIDFCQTAINTYINSEK
ncbi:hypothetical protein [uncultured Psychroserpens sp.]|uniref:hypothetical protein n=1 Tax=uncultured Psychroserpens sp. TaxID=255436 RepID=UPI0026279573|nr:hypothetical protein [uncultured Psychroserpens sp.]